MFKDSYECDPHDKERIDDFKDDDAADDFDDFRLFFSSRRDESDYISGDPDEGLWDIRFTQDEEAQLFSTRDEGDLPFQCI